MPCIIIRTNVEIPSDRAKELKTALAVSWEKVPTKRERWLMIVMEDKQQMFFSGRDTPAAFVNFKIHGDYDIGRPGSQSLRPRAGLSELQQTITIESEWINMEYKYKWYIPDAYLHSRGTGYFTSHEGCAFINETDRDAHVRFTFYFQDREPMTGYTSVVPARRTKHARFDLMENDKGEPVPMNVGYAVVVESDMDMPVQFSHCDTSQPELTFTTTMVPHITLDRED